jgi:hypothetical protein
MEDFEGIYSETERNKLISKEYRRLSKSIKDMDPQSQTVLNKLFSEAAFMAVTLEETRKIIIRDGIIEPYQNGATQKGLKKSSAVEVYDKMVNTYSKVIAQINNSLPDDKSIDPAEDIMRFAVGGKK